MSLLDTPAFTVGHFREWARRLIFEDGETRDPEDWQLAFVEDMFAGHRECWLIVPEGNGKSTFFAEIGLYGLNFAREPWIPIGAASRDQAEIIYGQAAGFVRRADGAGTEDIAGRFRAYDGYRKIVSKVNGGKGMKVYPHDPNTGDGVIPFPYALIDEPHRHPDMKLYSLWKGKLRKRKAQILVISTAGEPGSPFEEMRDKIRREAPERQRNGAHLRATSDAVAFHEYMVASDEDISDMIKVKAANPLSEISTVDLQTEFSSETLDLNEWKRLKCNRPARTVRVAVSDQEWDDALLQGAEIPGGERVTVGLDVAWKWDTTALVPLWDGPDYRLLGPATILVPPRDGSMLHVDEVKDAMLQITDTNPVAAVIMDTSSAQDVAHWIEEELGIEVIDRSQSNQFAVADYEAFMEGLRSGTLKHTGDNGLRTHVLNAIARRLPGGDHRFDRPTTTRANARMQDRRVIDALTAAAMVVEDTARREPPKRSVYEDRGVVAA